MNTIVCNIRHTENDELAFHGSTGFCFLMFCVFFLFEITCSLINITSSLSDILYFYYRFIAKVRYHHGSLANSGQKINNSLKTIDEVMKKPN